MGQGATRREALRTAGGAAAAVAVGAVLGESGIAVAVQPGKAAFLGDEELRRLRALVDVLIPADADGGALEAGCAEAIDALLGAFAVSPPRIYAGGPFSDRAGATRNDFATFLRLDRYEERAWRLRIEGSRGRKELERNGPVDGWQQVYRRGLAALGDDFAAKPPAERDLALRANRDPLVAALVEIAWPHTWEFFYGAPEYGGNRDRLGWRVAVWDGDVQPRGWTREEVEAGPVPGTTIVLEQLPLPFGQLLALSAFGGSSELAHNVVAGAAGRSSVLRRAVAPVLARADQAKEAGHGA